MTGQWRTGREEWDGELFRLVVENVQDYAIFVVDADRLVRSWSPGAERLLGYRADEIIGQSADRFFTPEDVERGVPCQEMHRALEIGRDEDDRWYVRKDGSRFWSNGVLTPLRDQGGTLRGLAKIMRDRTDLKRAEEALRSLREQLQIVTESMSAPVTRCSRDLRYLWVSKPYADWVRRPVGDIIGQPIIDIIGPAALEKLRPHFERVLAGDTVRYEEEVDFQGPGRRWISAVYTPTFDTAGLADGWVAVVIDITERKRQEQEREQLIHRLQAKQARLQEALRSLAASESRYRTIGELIPYGVWMLDGQGQVMHLSASFLDMLGQTLEDHVQTWPGRIHPDDYQRIVGGLPVWLKQARPWEAEYRIRGKDGKYRSILSRGIPLKDEEGRVLCWVGINLDLSGRKQLEEELRQRVAELSEAEGRIRSVVNNVIDGIITIDAQGTVQSFNPAAERIFGYSAAEVVGHNVKLLMPEPYHSQHDDYLTNYLRTGQARIIGIGREVVGRRKDGSIFPMDLAVGEFRLGHQRFFTGVVRDITERKRVEDALRFLADASASLAAVVDYESTLQKVAGLAVPHFADWCAVDMVQPDGSLRRLAVVHTDPAKVKLAHDLQQRYPPDPASPHGLPQVLRTGQPDMMADIPDSLIVQGTRDEEHLRILRQLGLKSYMCVPLQGRGRVLGVLSFVSAESGRRYTQADLAFAEELTRRAAIAIENAQLYAELREADRRKDEFLAMLAHELRNPLAPIRNALHIMKQPGADAAVVGRVREMMERQVRHMARLLDDLLDVSRISRGRIELRKEAVDVRAVVSRTLEVVRPLMEERRHGLTVSLPTGPLRVEADPARLEQVLTNLLNNAAKYTDPGGHIWLTAGGEGGEIVVRVRDTGIGLAPDVLPKVFDLFVQAERRLDRSQGGVGIGLTLVKRLVELHAGSIGAHSAGLGQGSEFVVRLPATSDRAERGERGPTDGATAHSPFRGPARRRVLVVDDNTDAADSLAMLVRLAGHDVRAAYDGPTALTQTQEFRPEMVLLDIGMPGMDGYEVARRLRQQPGLRDVLLVGVTGWGQQEDRRRTAEAGFDHHLVKPVEPKALEELLASLPACP